MEYKIKKKWTFPLKDATDIQRAIELMEKILEPIKDNTRYFSYIFDFYIGDMVCSCRDKNEFMREIFGLTDFRVTCIGICVFPKENSLRIYTQIFLLERLDWELSMSSDSKDILMEIVRSYDLCINEIANPPAESIAIGTYIDNSQHVSVNGSINQSVIGNNNTITDSCKDDSHIENSTSASKNSFWRPVLQSLTTKIFWCLLSLIGATVFAIIVYAIKFK